jgi:hypothetical protein
MALGDGIRRNIATVSPEERRRLRDAFIGLSRRYYEGSPNDQQLGRVVPGGVNFWYKQDEIHARTGIHNAPAFPSWHRELCNRVEGHLREVDPEISLHYWDWTTDPRKQVAPDGTIFSLFTPDFMGAEQGPIGEPWLSAGFYNPAANPGRDTDPSAPDPHEDPGYNAALPPVIVERAVGNTSLSAPDAGVITAATFSVMLGALIRRHNTAHGFIGGSIGDAHTSFRDPMVFLLHSNNDRLWARWQLDPQHPERLDPAQTYGDLGNTVVVPIDAEPALTGDGFLIPDSVTWGILGPLLPWSGFDNIDILVNGQMVKHRIVPIRPWAAPENEQVGHVKDSKHPSVVRPPRYDTNP